MIAKYSSLKGKSILFAIVAGLAQSGLAFAADEVGVLALYRVHDATQYQAAVDQFERPGGSRGCSIRLEGTVSGTKGPVMVPNAERFLLLDCETTLLTDMSGGAMLRPLRETVEDMVVIEGELRVLDASDEPSSSERAYTLKLSRYNDSDPKGREDDFSSLNRDASTREHAFHTEAMIDVAHASGIRVGGGNDRSLDV